MTQRFETFASLPPLSNQQIEAQAATLISKGYIPTIEFAEKPTSADFYWRLWPIQPARIKADGQPEPVTSSHLVNQIESCARRHPYAYVKLAAYNPQSRITEVSFICKTPVEGQ